MIGERYTAGGRQRCRYFNVKTWKQCGRSATTSLCHVNLCRQHKLMGAPGMREITYVDLPEPEGGAR